MNRLLVSGLRTCLLLVAVAPALPVVLSACSQRKQDEHEPSSNQTRALDEAIASATRAAAAASSAAVEARSTGAYASVTTATAPPAASSAPAAPAAPDSIAAQHVLVAYKGAERAPKTVSRSKADAKKRAEEVAAKAKAGDDFSKLVAEYSDDPAAKERQGSLGKFTRDKMNKAFSDAAFALKVDETSAPVETPFGFHVIRRNQ